MSAWLRALLTLTFLPYVFLRSSLSVCLHTIPGSLYPISALRQCGVVLPAISPNGKISQVYLVLFVRRWWFSVAPRMHAPRARQPSVPFKLSQILGFGHEVLCSKRFFAHSDVFPWRKNELPLSFRHRPTPCAVLPSFRIDRFPLMTSFIRFMFGQNEVTYALHKLCLFPTLGLCKT